MTESGTGTDGQRELCISGVLWHRCVCVREVKGCMWKKRKKKDEVQEEKRRQAGKMECGIENAGEELEGVHWENEMEEKRETERGNKLGVKVKYNRIPGSSEMFVTDMRHAWITSATGLIQCQLLNERQHSHAHQFLQGSSHLLAFCFSTWLHLQTLPVTEARSCISSLIKTGFGASLPPFFDGSLFMDSDFLPLTSLDSDLLRLNRSCILGALGTAASLLPPLPPSLVSPP